MIKFAYDHIKIVINIDETIRILRKYLKIKGYTYKITHISAAYSLKVANMLPTHCYDTALFSMVIYANRLIYILMNVNISIKMKRNITEK